MHHKYRTILTVTYDSKKEMVIHWPTSYTNGIAEEMLHVFHST